MKEITYSNLEDYLEKSDVFSDPKVIKMYGRYSNGVVEAITFMRTWLFRWSSGFPGGSNGEVALSVCEQLKSHGHKVGKIEDIVPLGRAI